MSSCSINIGSPWIATWRLLLLLTDGKPNDLDQYEGRYAIEDTRQAVREARRQDTFVLIDIDKIDADYTSMAG